ncbi:MULTISPECIES: maltokinase N-terminal cap-like domain-containing protein [unclassified Streptomyces]|uniref:maltokinase N-terminal cap-like domain-containing protein n=1 Tax=unclassified Streptomyces TaxID=2593676 RepID=UPI004041BF64
MAIIHRTTLEPTKLELLTDWLPSRPWYRGGPDAPVLTKSGGFRLEDPEGEVGIEFMVATDTSTPEPTAYLVPLTYRAAPLAGAGHALVGTTEHGVLGSRWVYDGCHDPVLVSGLLALIEGRAPAHAQSIDGALDPEVVRSYTGAPLIPDGRTPEPADDHAGTRIPAPRGTVLHIHRVPSPVPENPPLRPEGAIGHVARGWQDPQGAPLTAVLVSLHTS